MGGDGGSIPKRIDLVREKGQHFIRSLGGMGYTPNTIIHLHEESIDIIKRRDMRWSTCALSHQKLREPAVADRYGLLYNKEAVLLALVEKKTPVGFEHLRTRKDFRDCHGLNFSPESGRFVCPVTLEELSGAAKAWINWNCGCVTSDRADRNLRAAGGDLHCLVCAKPYMKKHVVPLIPTEDELAMKRRQYSEQKQATQVTALTAVGAVKSLEESCNVRTSAATSKNTDGDEDPTEAADGAIKRRKKDTNESSNTQLKRQKSNSSDAESSRSSKSLLLPKRHESEVFKALFTTNASVRGQIFSSTAL
eukprot:Filipodium_phascolosomae@DN2573_c0_g1_i1.p1